MRKDLTADLTDRVFQVAGVATAPGEPALTGIYVDKAKLLRYAASVAQHDLDRADLAASLIAAADDIDARVAASRVQQGAIYCVCHHARTRHRQRHGEPYIGRCRDCDCTQMRTHRADDTHELPAAQKGGRR